MGQVSKFHQLKLLEWSLRDASLHRHAPLIVSSGNPHDGRPTQAKGRQELLVIGVPCHLVRCREIEVCCHATGRQSGQRLITPIAVYPAIAHINFEGWDHRLAMRYQW